MKNGELQNNLKMSWSIDDKDELFSVYLGETERKTYAKKSVVDAQINILQKIMKAKHSCELAEFLGNMALSYDSELKTFNENKQIILERHISKVQKFIHNYGITQKYEYIISEALKILDELNTKNNIIKENKCSRFTKADTRNNQEICKDTLTSFGSYRSFLDDCDYVSKYGY